LKLVGLQNASTLHSSENGIKRTELWPDDRSSLNEETFHQKQRSFSYGYPVC